MMQKVIASNEMVVKPVDIQSLLQAVDAAASSDELFHAVENLAAARSPEAVPKLIEALNYNNPGAAVASVDGLIQIGEPAVLPILELLDGYNYSARAWAVRALAGIGDPRGMTIILDAALNDFAMSVRRAATKGLGSLQWDKLSPEDKKQAQRQCGEALLKITADEEWIVRYAAITGLQELAIATKTVLPDLYQALLEHLSARYDIESTLAVQARIRFAQQQLSAA